MYRYNDNDCYLMGQIYRGLLECQGKYIAHQQADMFPMRFIFFERTRAKKLNKKLENALIELMGHFELEDMDYLMDLKNPCPMDMRASWVLGFENYNALIRINPIEKVRKELKLTQNELALKIGVTQKDISRWENGYVKPSYDSLKKLSEVLGCTVDDLI